MLKTRLMRIRFAILMVLTLYFICFSSYCQENNVSLNGFVVDGLTSEPLPNATVIISWPATYEFGSYEFKQLKIYSNSSGFFTANVPPRKSYYILGLYYRQNTTLPCYFQVTQISFDSIGNISFISLFPSASIIIKGELYDVQETGVAPPIFNVLNPVTKEPRYPVTFGYETNYLFGINSRLIIVPAEKKSIIAVAPGPRPRQFLYPELKPLFILDNEGKYFELGMGEQMEVDLSSISLKYSLTTAKDFLNQVTSSVANLSKMGIYVEGQRWSLHRATALLSETEAYMAQGNYMKAFLDLKRAHWTTATVENEVSMLHLDADRFALFLIPFSAIFTIVLGFVLFEKNYYKVFAAGIFYILLYLIMLQIYPGYRLVESDLTWSTLIFSFATVLCLVFGLLKLLEKRPSANKEHDSKRSIIPAVLSLAKKNLKRRKFRAISTIFTVTTMVMGFVALTSFTAGYGVLSSPIFSATTNHEWIFVRSLGKSITMPYEPIEDSFLDLLHTEPNVELVSPWVENIPTLDPIGNLVHKNMSIKIFGYFGITPSVEAKLLRLNETVVKGNYLQDGEDSTLLLSTDAANKLKVNVGESVNLFNRTFTIAGIFDFSLFRSLKNLGRWELTPLCIHVTPEGNMAGPVNSDEFVITTWQPARQFPYAIISAVDVQTNNTESLSTFAEFIVAQRGYTLWISIKGDIHHMYLGEFFVFGGLAENIVLMILVSLMIFLVTYGSIYEREKEMKILSLLGVSPSLLKAVFLSEAAIIGILSGGLGLIVGLGLFPLLSLLQISVELTTKVSIPWAISGILLAIVITFFASLIPASKSPLIITPSLLMKWRIERSEKSGEKWNFELPIEIIEADLKNLFNFLNNRLSEISRESYLVENIVFILDKDFPSINYDYTYTDGSSRTFIMPTVTRVKRKNSFFILRLTCKSTVSSQKLADSIAHMNISMIRNLLLEWNVSHSRY